MKANCEWVAFDFMPWRPNFGKFRAIFKMWFLEYSLHVYQLKGLNTLCNRRNDLQIFSIFYLIWVFCFQRLLRDGQSPLVVKRKWKWGNWDFPENARRHNTWEKIDIADCEMVWGYRFEPTAIQLSKSAIAEPKLPEKTNAKGLDK